MQKVLQFLEKHCQWFAIGLGVLFLAYMVWQYTPLSPTPRLAVPIDNEQVLPGHIEERIDTESAKLDKMMSEKNPGFEIRPPDVLSAWHDENSLAKLTVEPLASPFNLHGVNEDSGKAIAGAQQNNQKLTALPKAPAPTPVAINTVRTVVDVPTMINGQPAVAAGGGAAGTPTDVDVVSVLFTINRDDLSKAFSTAFGNLAGLPPDIQQKLNETMVMSVDLVREEQMPNGGWGNATVVAPLPIHPIMTLPPQQNPPPVDATNFEQWAQMHTADILEPSYYEPEKGMPVIYRPDQQAPATPSVQPTAPPPPTRGVPPGLPRNFTLPRNGGNINGAPRGGRSGNTMNTPTQGATVFDAQFNAQGQPPRFGGGPMGQVPGLGGMPFAQQPQPAVAAGSVDANLINGKFDVTKLAKDIEILGHDDTVIPGHTYRYKARYTLYNTVFGIGNFANPASLATQLYLKSEDSAATGPITVPTRLRFFLASVFKNQVVFDVFTWKKGHWTKDRSHEMAPGDAIPGTDWSVLDIRDDLHGNGGKYALLINTDGTTEKHDVKSDNSSPDYQELESEVKSATAQANANGGG